MCRIFTTDRNTEVQGALRVYYTWTLCNRDVHVQTATPALRGRSVARIQLERPRRWSRPCVCRASDRTSSSGMYDTCVLLLYFRGFNELYGNCAFQLREYMSCTSNLAVLLAPTTTQAAPSTAPTLGRTEDTLLHIILRAKCIQSAVIESVIDRMLALCDGAAADLDPPYERGSNRDPVESSGNCGDDEKKALSVLCFNHLRWCDNIQDPEYLLASLLEALQVCVCVKCPLYCLRLDTTPCAGDVPPAPGGGHRRASWTRSRQNSRITGRFVDTTGLICAL